MNLFLFLMHDNLSSGINEFKKLKVDYKFLLCNFIIYLESYCAKEFINTDD